VPTFLFISPPADNLLYEGNYDPVLVSLSIIVAIFSAYASLRVSHHAANTRTLIARRSWVTAGGLSLGLGIWAMHFVGMLAFNLPCSTRYDLGLTLLSIIPGVLASILALHTISRHEISPARLGSGGLLIGAGVGAMHYSGMAAMRLDGMIRYDARLFLLSILVAVVLATFALWIKFRLQVARDRDDFWVTVISASVLGLAVSGMHYTAMLAAYFIRGDGGGVADAGIAPTFLAAIILSITGVIIVVTIVAAYVDVAGLLSLKRSSGLIGLLLVGWAVIAWVSADNYYNRLAEEDYRQESKRATETAGHVASNIEQNLLVLRGVPLIVARQEATLRTLRRFGAKVMPSALTYAERKTQWTRDTRLAATNDSLAEVAANLGADAIWIMNAAGDCIAASNSRHPDSFVGSNYADRDYFTQARAGQRGHQYAFGRTSRLPGLYYSDPVFDGGQFLGAVVVKRNISNFSARIGHYQAFLTDTDGVIVLAAKKDWEFLALPDAAVAQLAPDNRLLRYRQSSFVTLPITPWGDPRFPAAVRIGDNQVPQILSSKLLPGDSIRVYMPRPLDRLAGFDTERYWLFYLLSAAGGLLIVAASTVVIHLSESRATAADLRIAATAFEVQEGMLITDATTVILRVNQAFVEITGYSAEEAVGQTPRMLQSGRHAAAFYAAMWESVERSGAWQGEIWNRRKNGEVYPEWLMITAVKDDTGLATHYVGTFADITRRKTAEAEIENLAFYDPLTQLPNRRLLLDRLKQALASSTRNERYGALLFLDLDNFKTLNDTLGHDIGDLLLQQVALRLATCVREGDTAARLGGDEFVVMLEDLSENVLEAATQTEIVGEKILAALNQPYQLANYEHHSTPSIGVTLFADHQGTIDDLLKRADLAMYQAKAAGRNTLRFFDPAMQAVVTTRAALEADLREAVQKGQFTAVRLNERPNR